MKKSKIFIGFNNNRDRCLLYKIDSNNYLDLENNKKYNITDLLETTILPYQRFINLKGINTKNTIKKKYRLDSEKKLPVDDLYIGQLGEVTRIYDVKESLTKFNLGPYLQFMEAYCNMPVIKEDWYVPETVSYKYSYKVLVQDVLLQRIDNKSTDPDYICLLSNTKIPHIDRMLKKEDIIVGPNMKPFKEVIDVKEELLPKNKIMKLHMMNKTKTVDND